LLLTSPTLSPTNSCQIFFLLHTRLACLTLTGNTLLAAQESKCLEDLNSNFYYAEPIGGTQTLEHDLEHMVPWELRVLAVRLQSIGFSDGRRGVGGYYELATDARQKFRKATNPSEKELWKSRLSDLGLRVINAQIEMGDLSGAQQELESQMQIENVPHDPSMTFRLVLLLLRIGNVRQARKILGPKPLDGTEGVLRPLLSMAEGEIDAAVKQWEELNLQHVDSAQHALISQNLAVCYLYAGRMKDVRSSSPSLSHSAISHPSSSLLSLINGLKARSILENLVDDKDVSSFHSLTFNLATLYELCSEKSRMLKGRLVERVARKSEKGKDGFEVCEEGWEKVNADFKL
jgi:trafficking protein particle complex subunit 12